MVFSELPHLIYRLYYHPGSAGNEYINPEQLFRPADGKFCGIVDLGSDQPDSYRVGQ